MRPRIAIPVPNSDADYSARTLPDYRAAVEAAGGEAVEIPLTLTNSETAQLIKSCDAVLLPGSTADVDPQKYGAERRNETADADVARDNVDELLLQDAHNMRKPLLGICYGLQSLNVWRTGTLVQHIESDVKHARPKGVAKSERIVHEALVEPASELARLVASALNGERRTIEVNSSHHQAVEIAGDGLNVVARSKEDGVIEALEAMSDDHWVMGVQWHPERMTDAVSKALFVELVQQAREWHEAMSRSKDDFEGVRGRASQ
jgi:putative glutamine amidotransferase